MESGAASGGVGSIVWVRRRNGTWWPGKILGTDELPASSIASPRTGTPVKLLGREDASVDWYNLEKSKRVKAFRCGEFDDCIGMAEFTQGRPLNGREKYARREDAILQALEVEKDLLRKQGKLERPAADARSQSSASAQMDSGGSDFSSGRLGNSKSNQSWSLLTPIMSETVSSSIHFPKYQVGNQPIWEEDRTNILPRMRRLQDLGLRIASVKQELTSNDALDVDDTQSPSSRVSSMGRIMHINGGEQIGCDSRAKRSRCKYLSPESFDVLDYKKTPPDMIELSSSHFSECDAYPCPDYMIGGKISEFMEVVETGFSESTTSSESESESDSSETEPDMHEDITSHSGATERMDSRSGAFQRVDALAGLERDGEDYARHFDPIITPHANFSGKRRSMLIDVKLKVEASYEKEDDVPIISLERKLNGKAIFGHPIQIEVVNDDSTKNLHGNFSGKRRSMLVDVKLKMEASYEKEDDVPIISLKRKLDGKAISGHPIQIEVINDNSTKNLIPTNGPLSSAWKTARKIDF